MTFRVVGLALGRLFEHGIGVGGPPGVEHDQAHEMQGLRVARIALEKFPAQALGGLEVASLQEPERRREGHGRASLSRKLHVYGFNQHSHYTARRHTSTMSMGFTSSGLGGKNEA